jgi:hypothetical protein
MPQLFIIDEWSEQPWWNTGGTRDKKIYLNPEDGQIYYFKQSYRKGEKDYKYEFWSEIIAYEVGTRLGFEVIPYHVAKRGEVLGCISKTMIKPDEQLTEGGKYLQSFDPDFKPEDTKERRRYNFQLIEESLNFFNLKKYLPKIIDMIVFDALIGNSDRHQENWAIITRTTQLSKTFNQIKEEGLGDSFVEKIFKRILGKGRTVTNGLEELSLFYSKDTSLAPIYDSGCCFGRELTEEKVNHILKDRDQLKSYVERGKAEIHWNGEKISHFQLLENLLATEGYKRPTLESILKVIEKFEPSEIKRIIFEVDEVMESSGLGRHLPSDRKELIWELLALRHQKIREIHLKYQ